MVCNINNSCSSFMHFLIEPYAVGGKCAQAAFKPEKISKFFLGSEFIITKHGSLKDRVTSLLIGLGLLIPVINYIVLAILKHSNSSYLPCSNKVNEKNPWLREQPTAEVAKQRQTQAVERVAEIQKLGVTELGIKDEVLEANLPALKKFKLNAELLTFDLDEALRTFSTTHSVFSLSQLFTKIGIPAEKVGRLNDYILQYDSPVRDPGITMKKYLSQLFDCLNEIQKGLDSSEQKVLFLNKVEEIVDKIIDAHQNCADQVLAQMEEIMLSILDKSVEQGGLGERLLRRATVTIHRQKIYLLKEICIKVFGDDQHVADIFREVQQRLTVNLGIKAEIYRPDVLIHSDLITQGSLDRVSAEFARLFNPLELLISVLKKSYANEERKFRMDLLNWARAYYDLAGDNEELNKAISADTSDDFSSVVDGGTITNAGILLLLEQAGIIKQVE